MRNREVSDVEYGECGRCGGVFIDRVVIEHLLANYDDERVKVLLEALHTARYDADVPRVPTVRCPICGRRMDRKLSETGAGVIVDRCDAHGTYLDRGELQTLVAFVERDAMRRIREDWPAPEVAGADAEGDAARDTPPDAGSSLSSLLHEIFGSVR
jgi:Zn-finger nucleic acid-binding protein